MSTTATSTIHHYSLGGLEVGAGEDNVLGLGEGREGDKGNSGGEHCDERYKGGWLLRKGKESVSCFELLRSVLLVVTSVWVTCSWRVTL